MYLLARAQTSRNNKSHPVFSSIRAARGLDFDTGWINIAPSIAIRVSVYGAIRVQPRSYFDYRKVTTFADTHKYNLTQHGPDAIVPAMKKPRWQPPTINA